jgi:hypothetical protein
MLTKLSMLDECLTFKARSVRYAHAPEGIGVFVRSIGTQSHRVLTIQGRKRVQPLAGPFWNFFVLPTVEGRARTIKLHPFTSNWCGLRGCSTAGRQFGNHMDC